MNILVIGNGFDLAHGLPTKYTDFLNFMNCVIEINKVFENNADEIRNNIFSYIEKYSLTNLEKPILNHFLKDDKISTELDDFFKDKRENYWITYFFEKVKSNKMKGENWIDFESEISSVVKYIESFEHGEVEKSDILTYFGLPDNCLTNNSVAVTELISSLYDDLVICTDLLESYLNLVLKSGGIKSRSGQVAEIDKIISFNYTYISEYLYGKTDNIDFIHGRVGKHSLVLGTEETFEDEKLINNEISCIRFKKYFQRIYKQTGLKYKDWIKEPDFIQGQPQLHNVFIFGHSLDITDKDVLKEIMLHKNVATTTIYYHDEEAHARQIANLVKLIDKDEVIKRIGNGTIVLEKQKSMYPI